MNTFSNLAWGKFLQLGCCSLKGGVIQSVVQSYITSGSQEELVIKIHQLADCGLF